MEHQTTEYMLGLAEFKTTKNSSSVPLSPLSGDSKIIDLKFFIFFIVRKCGINEGGVVVLIRNTTRGICTKPL